MTDDCVESVARAIFEEIDYPKSWDLADRNDRAYTLAIAVRAIAAIGQWQPIKTPPELERVLVAGWQPRHGNVQCYWWYEEDSVWKGKAIKHTSATHWCPIFIPPFLEKPKELNYVGSKVP